MQNDCEIARDRDLGLAEPVALDELHPPGLHGGSFRDPVQRNPGRFKQKSFWGVERKFLEPLMHCDHA